MVLSDRLRGKFQLNSKNDISEDYFNDICIVEPEVLAEPERYFRGGEKELKEKLVESLQRFQTYTQFLQCSVDRYNAPARDFDGNLVHRSDPISIDDLITDKNREIIPKLDEVGLKIKQMSNSPKNINVQTLLHLMYEAALLVYGPEKEDVLKKRFYQQ